MTAPWTPPSDGLRPFSIFLASPTDGMQAAREAVAQALQAVSRDSGLRDRVQIRLYRWDAPHSPVSLDLFNGGQTSVNRQMLDPAEADLVIGLFGHHLGGTLDPAQAIGTGDPAACFGWSDAESQRPWHCAEWEVARARRNWVYFDHRPTPHGQAAVRAKVEDYEKRLQAKGHDTNHYEDEDDLANQVETALRNELTAWLTDQDRPAPQQDSLGPAQTELLAQLLAHQPTPEQPLPDPADYLVQRALTEPVQGLRGWLLQRYALGCRGSTGADGQRAVRLQREFVALSLTRARAPGQQGPGPEPLPFDDLAEALAAEPKARCWVLLGAPGAGKSTLLAHLEARSAFDALRQLQSRPRDRVPMALVARLGGYQPDAQGRWPTPADWLAAHWRAETGKAPDLSDALDLRWLLDGANEILAPTEAARQQALQAWAHWAAAVPAQQPAPLFSVREHELAPLQQAGLNPPQLQVQPWSDERIERYCQAQGQAALWPQIARHAHLRELARNPFNLAAQCQVGQQLGRPARHRAELLCALLQMRLRQPGNQRALAPVLASAPLHGDWVNAPMALDDPFTQALSTLALARQRDGQGLVGPQAQWLAGAGSHGLALLQAAQALHLLSSDSSEDPEEPTRRRTQWRWTHQLWHEFFAARGLVQADSHDLPIDALQPPPLPPIDWAAQQRSWQPLARAPVGPWDECLQLALPQAGLTRVLAWLAALQAAHPPLAARAAVQDLPRLGGHPQAAPLLGPLQAGLRRLSEDPAADLRQRIEAAELAHELGDERYQDLRRDGHAYRLPRQWVRVDVGPHFRLGTAGGPRNECGPDGLPVPCTVTPFDIAPAPVTNAEYALFMADQGYADPQWWPGPAGDWVRGGLDVSAQREAFRQRIGPLLPHLAEAPDISPETKAAVAKALAEGDAATQALINGWAMQGYPEPSGEPVTQPSLWNDPRFNHPSQPVVGVCVFEAQAYALWLAVRSGLAVTLPTEAQWEAAARGPGGRRWPWGDAPADPQDLPREQINHLTTALFRTAPVGLFAGCATPEGVQDLAGNVWEWCSTAYRDGQPLDALSCERALENNADTPRAVRGGAWSGLPRRCRAGYRSRFHPTNRLYDLGFRVVICPI